MTSPHNVADHVLVLANIEGEVREIGREVAHQSTAETQTQLRRIAEGIAAYLAAEGAK